VPTYEYGCEQCKRVFEVRQRISAAPFTICDVCGGTVRRLLSAAPFILKGGGWYVTDYPSESRKKAQETEKTSSTSTPSESKSETKSDTKPDSKSSTSTPSTPSSSSGSGA
jgi:putative FmdB family regulatory protein